MGLRDLLRFARFSFENHAQWDRCQYWSRFDAELRNEGASGADTLKAPCSHTPGQSCQLRERRAGKS